MASPAEVAVTLISELLAGQLSVGRFCVLYEQHWNFNWPGRELEPTAEQFSRLFEVAIWYCPFPEERAFIPNYTYEKQVLAVAQQVRAAVGA